jgi:hypothetical protein
LVHDPLITYALLWTFSFFWAYVGVLWLSLQAGLRGWRAHAPSLVLVTASYYITNSYARGAFGEFTASSAVPMLIAASVAMLRTPRADPVKLGTVAILIFSATMFTGAHNISLSWGTVFLASMFVIALWALPRHGFDFPLRRVLQVVGLIALGVAANAWYLLPDIAYASRTTIANGMAFFHDDSENFSRPSILFNPLRAVAKESTTPGLYTNLPVLVILWVLVTAWFIGRHAERPWRRAITGTIALATVLIFLLFWGWPWDHVIPMALQFIQFSYRLQSYILIALAFAVLLLLRSAMLSSKSRLASRTLAGILAFGFVLAIYQTWATQDMTGTRRQDNFKGTTIGPPNWYDPGSYRDATEPVVPTTPDRVLTIPPDQVKKDHFDGTVGLPAGKGPIATNIAGGNYLVKVTGPVRQVGRDPDGNMVLERIDPDAPAGWGELHISTARTFPVVAGRSISLLALVGIFALLIALATRRFRRPKAPDAGSPTAEPHTEPEPA